MHLNLSPGVCSSQAQLLVVVWFCWHVGLGTRSTTLSSHAVCQSQLVVVSVDYSCSKPEAVLAACTFKADVVLCHSQ